MYCEHWGHCSLGDAVDIDGGFPTGGRKESGKRETFLSPSSMDWGWGGRWRDGLVEDII